MNNLFELGKYCGTYLTFTIVALFSIQLRINLAKKTNRVNSLEKKLKKVTLKNRWKVTLISADWSDGTTSG